MNALRTARSCVLTAATVAAPAFVAAPATAQDGLPPVLDVRTAGIEAVDPAEKDRALHAVLPRLAERLTELPVEIALATDGDPISAASTARAIDLAWSALFGEAGLTVRPGPGPFGYGVAAWTDPAGTVTPDRLRRGIDELIAPLGMGFQETDAGPALMTPFGPAPLRTFDGDTAVISLGIEEPRPRPVEMFDLPRDATPLASVHVNLRELTAPLAPLLQAQNPELRQQLFDAGIIGPDAPIADAALGVDRELLHFTLRYREAEDLFEKTGAGRSVVFTERDLRVVPRDATVLAAIPFNLHQIMTVREAVIAAEGEDPLAMVEQGLGVDLDEALFENVGPRAIYYQSDSTGGGGLLSSVLIVELRDAAAFEDTLARAAELGNTLAVGEARGYVRAIERTFGGHAMNTLTFPGLPVPLELSWTVRGDRFIAAVSPTGLAAALNQIDDQDRHVVQARAFRDAVGSRMPRDGATLVCFVDNARFAPRGYGALSLGVSAFANGLRNPGEPDTFEAGALIPPFDAFVEGIEPLGAVAAWDGEDNVFHLTTDRSVLVNAAMVAGSQGIGTLQTTALAAGAMLPALGKARESARQLKSSTQVRAIVQGAAVYAQNHNDRMPASFDVMLEQGLIAPETLESPFGPAWDGGPDYAYAGGTHDFDARRIVAIDRAMYLNEDTVAVGFADTHVEMMPVWELYELLEQPVNEGTRAELRID